MAFADHATKTYSVFDDKQAVRSTSSFIVRSTLTNVTFFWVLHAMSVAPTERNTQEAEGLCFFFWYNGTSKVLGVVNFSSDLEISTAFAKSLEVSFVVHFIFRSRILACLVSASRRVSDFTLRHPLLSVCWFILSIKGQKKSKTPIRSAIGSLRFIS